jgi:hypothetical protein
VVESLGVEGVAQALLGKPAVAPNETALAPVSDIDTQKCFGRYHQE